MSEKSAHWRDGKLGTEGGLRARRPMPFKGVRPYLATSDVQGFEIRPYEYVEFYCRPARAGLELATGDVLQAKMKDTNKPVYVDDEKHGWLASTGFSQFTPGISGNSQRYFFHYLSSEDFLRKKDALCVGSTQQAISESDLARIDLKMPLATEQARIAEVLDVVNLSIEKTESLITKYQKIKAGLMHDLFTCGVTADGKLRPPREQAPELYQETPIGWIPKEWKISDLGAVAESLVDGPFGSNLKTEHYVIDPGVRVVRLQNIQATTYNDDDRAYVTEKHANFLARNKVVSGDILIAGLGEERYPVGRACLYPQHLPPAINKADCFRLRCNIRLAVNPFVMSYLNTSTARRQIVRYEQGVTRPRINLGNLKKVLLPRPSLIEQEQIWERLANAANQIDSLESVRLKLSKQKSGLMHDLLTGKVKVVA